MKYPGWQLTQEVRPAIGWTVPKAHFLHKDEPLTLVYLPAGQFEQFSARAML